VAGRKSLRVVLRGPAGNPTAVGALLTAEFADGTTQACEIYAGSGYYSQSSGAAFFGSPAANPLKRIRVRWPSGAVSTHDATLASSSLVLTAPPSVGEAR
jgi:hypothetical protein